MKRAAFPFASGALSAVLGLLGLLTPACGLFASAQTSSQVASDTPSVGTGSSRVLEGGPADTRKVGDFRVHRFSGSYQKTPLTLTEE
ncbi:MAG TPA: hypothetical protein VFK05_32960, partial [Polyangiaceae bacterium]|nr:hypothetical protein [Polyangiaceae bacterium]